jgi:hypothetical protein
MPRTPRQRAEFFKLGLCQRHRAGAALDYVPLPDALVQQVGEAYWADAS